VNRAGFNKLSGGLDALAIRLADRIAEKDLSLISEFVDVGEFGIALEWITDLLSDNNRPLTSDERSAMLALAERMGIRSRVAHALDCRPDA
jgi:hypothetical protein